MSNKLSTAVPVRYVVRHDLCGKVVKLLGVPFPVCTISAWGDQGGRITSRIYEGAALCEDCAGHPDYLSSIKGFLTTEDVLMLVIPSWENVGTT